MGVSNPDQSPEGMHLVRQFLLFLAIFAAATWGISRLPSVEFAINPEVKVREQLSANPDEAIRKYAPSDAAKVQAALGSEVGRGVKLEDAFVRIRPLFATLVRERLGFVYQATAVAWAHVMRDTLQQMKAADPQKRAPVRRTPSRACRIRCRSGC